MGRGSSKAGGNSSAGGTNKATRTAEFKESYDDEMSIRREDVPIGSAMSYENRDDSTVETQMRGYASAIGDPIKAMESARNNVKNVLSDYEGAKSQYDLGTKQALTDILKEYDAAISRMKKIKANSSRPDLL